MENKVKIYNNNLAAAGNLLCAIDTETSGLQPGYNEILQIAIQPLDENYEPYPGVLPFYLEMSPEFPERVQNKALEINGMTLAHLMAFGTPSDKGIDLLVDWFKNLHLAGNRKIIPLAQNWPFDYAFIVAWLGMDLYSEIFTPHYRDTMNLAITTADLAAISGCNPPLKLYNLKNLCTFFGITYDSSTHDALRDALATASVYPKLLMMLRQFLS